MTDSEAELEVSLKGRDDSYIQRVETELRSGDSQTYKWFEHFDRWCQSIRPMGMLHVALSVIVVYAGFWSLSFLIAPHLQIPEFGPTQGAVIVGLVGVYLGFSTLSIQLHAGRIENEASVAVPFIVRTHWLYLNWGVGLGVVVANFAALVLLDVGVSATLHGISVANYLSVILLAGLIARFLYMTASDATLDMVGFVMRIAPRALAERVELVRRTNGVRNAFSSRRALSFRTSSYADDIEIVASADPGKWFVGIDESGVKELISWLKSHGYEVSHVDIPVEGGGVATLKLRPHESATETEITIEEDTGGPKALDGSENIQTDSNRFEEQATIKFQKILRTKLRQRQNRELLHKSFSIWHYGLVDAADGGRSGEFKLRLDWVSDLITEISGKKALEEMHSGWPIRSGIIGDPPLWVDIHAIADAVLSSSNPLSLDAIIEFLEDAAITGKNQDDHILVDRALGVLQYIHYQAHPRQKNGSQKFYSRTERQLDSFVKSKLSMQYWIKSHFHATDRMFLSLGLSLTKTAMELGEVDAARSFANRLNDCFWDGDPDRSFVAPDGKSPKDDVILGIIALQGWCIAMMERKNDLPSRQGAAEAVLKVLRCPVTNSKYLIWLWEEYGGIGRDSEADVKLLLRQWDPDTETDQPERPGMSSAHMVDGSWGLKGLLMLLLKAGSPIGQLGQYFSDPPPERIWDNQSVISAFKKITELNLDTGKQELIPKITDMLWRRERWGLAEFAKRVAEIDIEGTPQLTELLSDVSEVEGMQFPGLEILTDLGVVENADIKTEEATVLAAMGMPRDYFTEGNSWGSGFGKQLRDVIGKRNSMNGFWSAEQNVSQYQTIESKEDVRAAVDSAIEDLRKDKFNPDVLIVPDIRRPELLEWIFEKKRWELADRRQDWSLYLGSELGLAILRWPYTNASNILVAEAKQLFGFCPGIISEITVEWTDASDEERRHLLDTVKLEMDAVKSDSPLPEIQPDPRSLKVKITAKQQARLGVLNVLAARKIDVSVLLQDSDE